MWTVFTDSSPLSSLNFVHAKELGRDSDCCHVLNEYIHFSSSSHVLLVSEWTNDCVKRTGQNKGIPLSHIEWEKIKTLVINWAVISGLGGIPVQVPCKMGTLHLKDI